MESYLRKMAIDGYIIQIDHSDIKAMTCLLYTSKAPRTRYQIGEELPMSLPAEVAMIPKLIKVIAVPTANTAEYANALFVLLSPMPPTYPTIKGTLAMFLYLPHTIRYCIALKKYPTMIMPTVHIAMKIPSNFGLTAFRNMITDGSESVVTPIIKDRATPSCAPVSYTHLDVYKRQA